MPVGDLAKKKCTPCEKGGDPLKGQELAEYKKQLPAEWKVIDDHHLVREYKVDKYKGAVDLANKLAKIADEEDHHPEIMFTWGKVNVKIYTHAVDGLTENDFIYAAKAEEAAK